MKQGPRHPHHWSIRLRLLLIRLRHPSIRLCHSIRLCRSSRLCRRLGIPRSLRTMEHPWEQALAPRFYESSSSALLSPA
jgi:hypothetical protein